MNRHDTIILEKICDYCSEIGGTHELFKKDKNLFFNQYDGYYVYRNSITMPILQIGELGKNLTDDFRKQHHDIPWRVIMGMRDIFAHHYGALDYNMTWNTSISDIPELKDKLQKILDDNRNSD